MGFGLVRLAFGLFWLGIGLALLTRPYWAVHVGGPGKFEGNNVTLMGTVAVVLALWNLGRWWATRRSGPDRSAEFRAKLAARRRPEPTGDEYHPEFDFNPPR